jgi:hypothetical protein
LRKGKFPPICGKHERFMNDARAQFLSSFTPEPRRIRACAPAIFTKKPLTCQFGTAAGESPARWNVSPPTRVAIGSSKVVFQNGTESEPGSRTAQGHAGGEARQG